MRDRLEGAPRPLPAEILPDPQPAAGSPECESTVERIVAAAEPELWALDGRRVAAPSITRMWKPAAALAAAATALLLLVERPAPFAESRTRSLPLSLMATGGHPVSLWESVGIPADTVLALIAIQREDLAGRDDSPSAGPEERR